MNLALILSFVFLVGTATAASPEDFDRESAACCDVCKNVTTKIAQLVQSPRLKTLLRDLAILPCKFKVDKHKCEIAAVTRVDQLLSKLTAQIQNSAICDAVGCCQNSTLLHTESSLSAITASKLDCKHCTLVAKAVATAMKTSTNTAVIQQYALLECAKFSADYSDVCLTYVLNKVDQLIKAVQQSNSVPEKACQLLKFCPASSPADTCQVCETLLDTVKTSFLQEAQLNKGALEAACHQIDTSSEDCGAMIDVEVATFTSAIDRLLAPKRVCKAMQLCRPY